MEEMLKKLEELNLPKDQFAVFGSGPMAIRGMREAGDLDLIVTDKLWQQLIDDGHKVIKETWHEMEQADGKTIDHYREYVVLVPAPNIEVFNKWPFVSASADELVAEAKMIDGVPFVSLDRVIEWKTGFNRPKDHKDVEMIKKFLEK